MNPWRERWTWERGIPLRYVLVAEKETDEEGRTGVPYACGYDLEAKCADIEGLFVQPPPPPREELVLFDCAPLAALRDAVDGRNAGRVGDVWVEVSLKGEKVQDWDYRLHDAVILDHRRSPEDPSLVDMIVEAGVETPDWYFGDLSESRQRQLSFELFQAEGDTPYGSCGAVPGLFVGRPDRRLIELRLIGCEPGAPLLSEESFGATARDLLALDRTGRVMTGRETRLWVTESSPSRLGDGLLDVTLRGWVDDQPLPALEAVWAAWWEGRPATPNQWASFPEHLRGEWLWLTEKAGGPDRQGGEYHLDGRFVTGHDALYCALGEAVNGPGGYYGRCWNSLFDCLRGGFGATPPFTLVWHDFEVARRALADEGFSAGVSYAEEVVGRLRSFGVTVEMR